MQPLSVKASGARSGYLGVTRTATAVVFVAQKNLARPYIELEDQTKWWEDVEGPRVSRSPARGSGW